MQEFLTQGEYEYWLINKKADLKFWARQICETHEHYLRHHYLHLFERQLRKFIHSLIQLPITLPLEETVQENNDSKTDTLKLQNISNNTNDKITEEQLIV